MLPPCSVVENKEVAALSEIQSFKHQKCIQYFEQVYESSWNVESTRLDLSTEQLWTDMLSWLWLSHKVSPVPLWVSPETLWLDRMWHTFILFTKDYISFCENYFGQILHHEPLVEIIESESDLKERQNILKPQLYLIGKELGESYLRRWYLRH